MLLWMRILDNFKIFKGRIDEYVGESLNIRLKTQGLDFENLVYEADKQGTNIIDVML